MRDIKFRGKSKNGNEYFIGDLTHVGNCVFIFPRSAPLNSPDWFEVDPNTVCQFAGIKSKNGEDIYEGDILLCTKFLGGNFADYAYDEGYVEFLDGAFGLCRKEGYYRPFRDWFDGWEFEIKGSIVGV